MANMTFCLNDGHDWPFMVLLSKKSNVVLMDLDGLLLLFISQLLADFETFSQETLDFYGLFFEGPPRLQIIFCK